MLVPSRIRLFSASHQEKRKEDPSGAACVETSIQIPVHYPDPKLVLSSRSPTATSE